MDNQILLDCDEVNNYDENFIFALHRIIISDT